MNTHLGIYSPWLQEVLIALERIGLKSENLLEAHCFNGQLLNAWIEVGVVRQLWWKAFELSQDPLLGLKAGMQMNLRAFNVVAPMLSHSPNFQTALQTIQKYQSLISQSGHFVLSQEQDSIHLNYKTNESHIDTHYTQIDSVFSAAIKLIRSLLSEDIELEQLNLSHENHGTITAYEDYFQCKVVMGMKSPGFVLHRATLNQTHTTADPRIYELCKTLADDRLRQINNSEQLLNNVSESIAGQHYRRASLDTVAQQLNMSPRTLQRKLNQQGITFQQASEQVIVREATRLLESTQLSIFEISDHLGYSNTSSFSRAFKSWTSKNPGEFR